MIYKIKDNQGERQRELKKIEGIINDYFLEHFSSIRPSNINEVMHFVGNHVSNEFNGFLSLPFTKLEIMEALFLIGSAKIYWIGQFAHKFFFQKYWARIRDEILKALLSFLNEEASLGDLNKTFIIFDTTYHIIVMKYLLDYGLWLITMGIEFSLVVFY